MKLSVFEGERLTEVLSTDTSTEPDPFATPGQAVTSATRLPATAMEGTSYTPGTTVDATLEFGIITLGDAMPIVARDDAGGVWQGMAELSDNIRFTLTFTSVTKNGALQQVQAQAVGLDGYAGVAATIQETTPALASDLLRGTLRGVCNYVEGLSKQRSVTVTDLGQVITQTAPSLEAQIAGSVSKLFTPDLNQPALVRIAELKQGVRFNIVNY